MWAGPSNLEIVTALRALALAFALFASPAAWAEPTDKQECCKVCRKGKACGDTCISRKKTCRKPAGCACDAGGADGPGEKGSKRVPRRGKSNSP